jgi:hypothetical protein
MIKEFALDPQLCQNHEFLRRVTGTMGLDQGRYIAGYPTKKEWLHNALVAVQKASNKRHKKSHKIREDKVREECLLALNKGHYFSEFSKWCESYNDKKPWLENTLQTSGLGFFSAVVSSDSVEGVTHPDEIDYEKEPFKVLRDAKLKNTGHNFAQFFKFSLERSRELVFRDRFLDVNMDKGLAMFREILKTATSGTAIEKECIEIHMRPERPISPDQKMRIEHYWRSKLRGCVSRRVVVDLYFWDFSHNDEWPHPRIFMTENILYHVDHGFGSDSENCLVTRCSPELYENEREEWTLKKKSNQDSVSYIKLVVEP